jgi:hypothetical protein
MLFHVTVRGPVEVCDINRYLFCFLMLQVDQEEGGEDSVLSSGEGSGRGETGGLLPPFPPPPPGPDGMSVLEH